jgi:hypothetical protein
MSSLSKTSMPALPAHDGDSDILSGTVTDPELAAELKVSLPTIRRWSARGLLPAPLKVPGRVKRRSRAAIFEMFREGTSPPRSRKRGGR